MCERIETGKSINDWTLALCLFLFLSSVYLLSYSGAFHSSDEMAMFVTAQSIVQRGQLDIEPLRGMGLLNGVFGPDGRLYGKYGLGIPLLTVPVVWLANKISFLGNVGTAMLLDIPVTALIGVFLFLFIRRLGYPVVTAIIAALAFGLGTTSWVYAKYLFSEPLTALCLLVAFYFLLRYRQGGEALYALGAGLATGYAVITRVVDGAMIAPLLFLYGFWRWIFGYIASLSSRTGVKEEPDLSRDNGGSYAAVFLFCAPIGLALGGYLLYSYACFGSLARSGQPMHFFGIPLTRGLYGLLLSPGRGLFVYAPLLLLAIPGSVLFWRRHRAEAWWIAGLNAAYLLLYGTWTTWFGGDCWGPRHILPLIPFLCLFLAPIVEKARTCSGWRLAFAVVLVLSILAQVGGLAVPFGLHLDTLRARGFRTDAYEMRMFFDPRYAPLWGHWMLLQPGNLDLSWMRVLEPDGPATLDGPVLIAQLALVILATMLLLYFLRRPKSGWKSIGFLLAGLILAVGVSLFSLGRCYYDARGERGDYRLAAKRIHSLSRAGDAIVFHAPIHTAALLEYYKGSLPMHGIRDDFDLARKWMADLISHILPHYHRVWWLTDSTSFPRGETERWLIEHGYQASDDLLGRTRLALYALSPSLPVQQTEVRLGDAIALEGYGFDAGVPAGDILRLELRWRALASVEEDKHVFVHLLDQRERLWAQRDSAPLLGLRPTSTWEAGEELNDRYGLLLPPAMPPGPYELHVGLYQLDGKRLTTAEGKDHVALGEINVLAAERWPEDEALNIQYPLRANFGGRLELLGCNLPPLPLESGGTVPLAFFWRALTTLEEDYQITLEWRAEDGRTWSRGDGHLIGDVYPTSVWREGQVIEDRWDVIVPPDLPNGPYRLIAKVGSQNGAAGAEAALLAVKGWPFFDKHETTLAYLSVVGRKRSYEIPAMEHPLEARFGEMVKLVGYDLGVEGQSKLPYRIEPGEVIHLTLYWQALAPMEDSYTVFTHLLDGEGRVRGQKDNLPGNGAWPTNSWAVGEVIRDEYDIPVGANAPPGDYVIAVGLYLAESGRLPASGPKGPLPQDRVILGEGSLKR